MNRDLTFAKYKKLYPHYPDYVINEIFYPDEIDDVDTQSQMHTTISRWELQSIKISLQSFDHYTTDILCSSLITLTYSLISNTTNAYTEVYHSMCKQIDDMPIVCVQVDEGLRILEGWHRTTCLILLKEKKYNAWIGY